MSQKVLEFPSSQIHRPLASIIEEMVMRIVERELSTTQEMPIVDTNDEEIDAFERSFIWQYATDQGSNQ
jgi:hypothetical protein